MLVKVLDALFNLALNEIVDQVAHLSGNVEVIDRRDIEVAATIFGRISSYDCLVLFRPSLLRIIDILFVLVLAVFVIIDVKCDAFLALLKLLELIELDNTMQPLA